MTDLEKLCMLLGKTPNELIRDYRKEEANGISKGSNQVGTGSRMELSTGTRSQSH